MFHVGVVLAFFSVTGCRFGKFFVLLQGFSQERG
jgi:hypothetical protein